MIKPLAIDLFCGLGGWTEGLLAEGYEVIGFDIERHQYGEHRYPAQLVIQDVLTLHGSQFRDAALIVASPPCQAYSYRAMPWKRAKALPPPDNTLFEACFRIQREACEAAGRHIPLIVENVRGAQPWVGRARWNFGSFYLWGDVPALMPITLKIAKVPGFRFDGSGKSFNIAHNTTSGKGQNPCRDGKSFQTASVEGRMASKQTAMVAPAVPLSELSSSHRDACGGLPEVSLDGRKGIPHRTAGHWTNPAEHEGIKHRDQDGYPRDHPHPFGWKAPRTSSTNKTARKAASAMIARIPQPLARHIARTFHSC